MSFVPHDTWLERVATASVLLEHRRVDMQPCVCKQRTFIVLLFFNVNVNHYECDVINSDNVYIRKQLTVLDLAFVVLM